MRCRAGVALALALVAGAASGCARSEAAQVKGQMEAIRRENSWEKLYERGKGFALLGDYTRAEQYLAASLDAGGDGKKIVPLLMGVCVESKKYRVAIDYGEAQLKRQPSDVKLRHLVGALYMALGEVGQARGHFKEVLAKSPNEAETHYAIAVLYRDTDHDLLRADEHFRAYLRINPSGDHAQEARQSLLKAVP